MSVASREYFQDWVRECERDSNYHHYLAEMAGDDVFTSRTLKAADLNGKKLKLTIANVEMEKMGDDTKPVMYFKGKEKGLAELGVE